MSLYRVLLALLLLMPGIAAAQPSNFPPLSGRVVDAANVLSPEQEAQLTQLSADVEKASSRQLVVATIPDLQGYDIADYGYQLGRFWKIGQKDANNGIVLIVAPKERKVRIEVGYGLEPIMTDGLSSTIISDTIIPKFRAGDMPGGIVAGAQAIAEQMKLPLEAAEQNAQAATQKTATQTRQRSHGGGGIPVGIIFWAVIFFFVVLPMLGAGLGRSSRRGPWGAQRYSGGGNSGALPIILWTIANEIGRESSRGGGWGGGSGGGGWGGGDSGGGGGGFSGGGGSFGGGGASGSW